MAANPILDPMGWIKYLELNRILTGLDLNRSSEK